MATSTSNLGLQKPDYRETADIAVLNGNSDKIDSSVNATDGAIAIVSNGNTHPAIPSRNYVYIRGHGSLSEGLYKNSTSGTIGVNATLSSSNVSAISSGGMNEMKSITDALNSKTYGYNNVEPTKVSGSYWTSGVIRAHRKGCIVTFKVDGAIFSAVPGRTLIATLPSGYRPVTEVAFWDDSKTRQFVISTNGDIKAGEQSAGQAWGAVTYVCDFY